MHLVFEAGSSRVVGVWTRLWTRVLADRGAVRAVKLRAGAIRRVLPDVEAHALTNRIRPLDEFFDGVDDLTEAILEPPDAGPGLDILTRWLGPRLKDDPEADEAVAIVEHVRTAGSTRVEEVAVAHGMTVRALQRRFRRHVGASPKTVIRRMRLQEVAARVELGEAPDLATLAHELRYADQAHLARDFRAATGLTLRGFERNLDAEGQQQPPPS